MRWNGEITLRDILAEAYIDDEGNEHEGEPVDTTVMCNNWSVGRDTWATAAELGFKPTGMVQIRTVDYNGQMQCIYRGEEMDISMVTEQGENTMLTLSKHARNDVNGSVVA